MQRQYTPSCCQSPHAKFSILISSCSKNVLVISDFQFYEAHSHILDNRTLNLNLTELFIRHDHNEISSFTISVTNDHARVSSIHFQKHNYVCHSYSCYLHTKLIFDVIKFTVPQNENFMEIPSYYIHQ